MDVSFGTGIYNSAFLLVVWSMISDAFLRLNEKYKFLTYFPINEVSDHLSIFSLRAAV